MLNVNHNGLHLTLRKGITQQSAMRKERSAAEIMKTMSVNLLRPDAKLPERKTAGSVGYDIFACMEEAEIVIDPGEAEIVIDPGETKLIGSGVAIALDPGYAAFIYARSGLGIKHGIIPANCVGVIDSDYRGEIIVGLKNTSNAPFTVKDGDRIAQMVIAKCELPELVITDDLDGTPRGSGGFGSTGS